ncbi:MAG: M56 family metallopeptidase [Gemmataceae bacterium]
MTSLALLLGWVALRVTPLAALGLLLCWWSGRREARTAVLVGATALLLALAPAFTGLCPLPDRWNWSPFDPVAEETSARDVPSRLDAREATEGTGRGVPASTVWRWLGSLSSRQAAHAETSGVWSVLALGYLLGVSFAALRLVLGWFAVARLRRHSVAIQDQTLLDLLATLRPPGARPIAPWQCDEPGLAATVGWWRPVILLPPEWRSWTTEELRAVLAHELAHVRHRDYLIGLLAAFCRALHFYHPLVRWLTAQVRWQQEVAADAAAASALGGRGAYRKALARIALRTPDRTPARPLPAMSGGALLRRIEMLNGTERTRPLSRRMRGLLVGAVAAAAIVVSTFTTPAAPPRPTPPVGAEPFELGYVAPDAKGFVAVRPALWLREPGMDRLAGQIEDGVKALKTIGITLPAALRPANIEQFVANVHLSTAGTGKPGSRSLAFGTSSMLIRMNQDFDWVTFAKDVVKQLKPLAQRDDVWKKTFHEVEELRRDGITFYRLGTWPMLGPTPIYLFTPDRRTAVFFSQPKEDEEAFVRLITNAPAARKRDWGTGLKQVDRAPLACVLDNSDQYYAKLFDKDLQPADRATLEKVRFATVGVELGEGRPVRLILDATSTADGLALERACDGYARAFEEQLGTKATEIAKEDEIVVRLATELLKSRRGRRDGARLEWVSHSSVRAGALFADLKRPE